MAEIKKKLMALRIADCSFPQIQQQIAVNASLILPVGSLEPIGTTLAIGAVNVCCATIAEALSSQLQILVAPMLTYGYNTPFRAFAGCGGVHYRTQVAMIADCCASWFFQGFKRIIIITFAMNGWQWMHDPLLRSDKQRNEYFIELFSLQDEPFFRSLCTVKYKGKEFGRSEWGIHALVSYICPELRVVSESCQQRNTLPDEHVFQRWRKCGQDPEKLRKMVPNATLSDPFSIPDASDGKELFDSILTNLTDKITIC